MQQAKELQIGPIRYLTQSDRTAIMQSHAQKYYALPPEKRLAYEMQAHTAREDKRSEAQAFAMELQIRQDLLVHRTQQQKQKAYPWRLAACKLDTTQRDIFQRMVDAMSQRHAGLLRQEALKPPALPAIEERLAMAQIELLSEVKTELPQWAKTMCYQREHFKFCAVLHREWLDDDMMVDRWCVPLVSCQQPLELSVANLDEEPQEPEGDTDDEGPEGDRPAVHWKWQFQMWTHVWDHSSGLWPQHHWKAQNMWVLPGLIFLRGSQVVSSHDIVSWADFVSALPPAKIAKATDAAARARPTPWNSRAVLMAQHPWAMQYLEDGMQILKKARVWTQMTKQKRRRNHRCLSQRIRWMKSLRQWLKPEPR